MLRFAAYSIQQELVATDPTGLRAVYGVCLLETREVWAPRLGNTEEAGLAAAPPTSPDLPTSVTWSFDRIALRHI